MLFRKPVLGDWLKNRHGLVHQVVDVWGDHTYASFKDEYSFVQVTDVEPPITLSGYVNIYPLGKGKMVDGRTWFSSPAHSTREIADMNAGKDRMACVRIEFIEWQEDE